MRRLGSDIVDRAAGRVLAEQRALRPFQNLNPLKVERSVRAQDRERQRGLIKIDANRRIDAQRAFLEADAAQGKDRGVGRACRIGKAGDDRGDILKRTDPALLKCLATDRGNRQTNLIEVLVALVCGHHDLVLVGFDGGALRKCGTGAAHRGKRDQRRI